MASVGTSWREFGTEMCRVELAPPDREHSVTDAGTQHHYNPVRPDKVPGVDVVKHVPTAKENSGTERSAVGEALLMARQFERWDLQRGLD